MNVAILTAAGVGSRFGQDVPKQFLSIDDKPLIVYTMEKFQQHPDIDEIAVVCLEIHRLTGILHIRLYERARPVVGLQIAPEEALSHGYLISGETGQSHIHSLL